ncbi:hypothetical protein [uncultured Clostridium sp.]|uniref:hypothetical protein n=1 Tax=uncultured Clostridium sp. TaxID=59620 RepID=UPI0026293A75|nr:hypothetical protein [uncultured Clostridium sp.]
MSDKVSVSFKDSVVERELYEWVKEKSEIIGMSAFIKQSLYEKMLDEKKSQE